MAVGEGTAWGLESLFRINGLVLNDQNLKDRYVVENIAGIQDDPELKASGQGTTNPNDHGEIPIGNPLYDGRTVVLRGRIEASSSVKLRQMQRALKRAVTLGPSVLYIEPDPRYVHQNLITNPSLEVDATGWSGTGAARDSTWGAVGASSFRVVRSVTNNDVSVFSPEFPVIPGETVQVMVTYRVGSGNTAGGGSTGPRIGINFDPGNGTWGSVSYGLQQGWPAVGSVGLMVFSAVVPAGHTKGRIRMLGNTTGTQTVDLHWDAARAIMGKRQLTASDYMDGDSEGWNWYGEPGKSASGAMVPVQLGVRKGAAIPMEESQQDIKMQRPFMVTLRCPNPRILSQTERTLLVTATPGVKVTNAVPKTNGDFPAQTVVRFNGPMGPNPDVFCGSNGRVLLTALTSIANGSWVEYQYDGNKRRVIDNAGNIRPSLFNSIGDWMMLEPGANLFALEQSINAVAPSSVNLTWRDTWI